jgi:SAM-dependent methyltransferase
LCSCQIPELSPIDLDASNTELYSEISKRDLRHPFQEVEDLERRSQNDARIIKSCLPSHQRVLKVLEIGPGLGHLGRILQKDFDYFAADLVPNYLRELALPPGRSLLWDVTSGGVTGEFDVIVACDVFEHLLNEGDAWLSVFDALKPGGIFYIRVPYREPLINYSRLFGAPYPYVHLRSYTLGYMREMGQYSGFTIKKIRKTYHHRATYARRGFGLTFLKKRHSKSHVSGLRLGYSELALVAGAPNMEATKISKPSYFHNLLRRIFNALGPGVQSISRNAYKLFLNSTSSFFFRPSEVALVLEKKTLR